MQVGHWLCNRWALPPGSAAALAVHLAWGQASSIAVEVAAVAANLWSYTPSPGNPSLVMLWNGKHLTALPQLIWLAASSAFWLACLALR